MRLVWILLSFLAVSVNSKKLTPEQLDTIKSKLGEATVYVTQARKALEADDPKTFVATLGKLVGMIPGPIGAIGSGILGAVSSELPTADVSEAAPVDEFALVVDKLVEINGQIEGIAQSVEEFKNEIIYELRMTQLSAIETALDNIELDYKKLLAKNNRINRDRMILTCNNAKYTTIARWIRDEVLDVHTTQPIAAEIRKKNDRQLYFNFTKTLVGHFLQATVLQTACTSLIFADSSPEELNETMADDSVSYQKMLTEIKDKIAADDESMLKNFWKNAQADIETLSIGKDVMDHQLAADIYYGFLTKKYYWRQWFVAVYGSAKTVGFEKHSFNWKNSEGEEGAIKNEVYESYFKNWIRLHNRNIIIASPPEDPPQTFLEKAEKCINDAPSGTTLINDCKQATKLVETCMKETAYMALGCTKDMKHFAVTQNATGVVHKRIRSSHTGGFTASITVSHYYELFLTY